jgi:hypothetical protein
MASRPLATRSPRARGKGASTTPPVTPTAATPADAPTAPHGASAPPRPDAASHRDLIARLGLVGLSSLEPIVLASLATQSPLLLIGTHGSGKSLLLERIANALSLEWRHYNAALVNFDDLVGYPLPDERGQCASCTRRRRSGARTRSSSTRSRARGRTSRTGSSRSSTSAACRDCRCRTCGIAGQR